MCNAYTGSWFSSDWDHNSVPSSEDWYGMGGLSAHGKIGLLLDLDQGKLFVYKNNRKLGVMKRGLAGQYCWVVSIKRGTKVTIKRGPVPLRASRKECAATTLARH